MTVGERRRLYLRALLAVLIVALPLSVYLWGRGSSAFAVERIELAGARRVSAARAAATLRAHFLGHNLFGVHAGDVAAALRPFPYVDHVEVDRDFPGTLRVRIVEYRPGAVLFSAGRWYVVSREGRVLMRLPGDVTPPAAPAGYGATTKTAQTTASVGAAVTSTATADGSPLPSSHPAATSTTAAGDAASPIPAATSTTASAGADAAQSAAALAASISSASLTVATHAPSLFAGDLSPATLATVTLPRQARRLPVLVTLDKVKVGSSVDDRHVQDALAVLAALPARLRRHVLLVSVTPAGVDVVLRNGVTYDFGDARDLPNKVLALQAVLGVYRRHHLRATWIDVSVANRPLGTPIIVSRPAPLQTVRPTPKPKPKPTASGLPSRAGASPSPSATSDAGVSPSPKSVTASPSPRPKTTATAKPSGGLPLLPTPPSRPTAR